MTRRCKDYFVFLKMEHLITVRLLQLLLLRDGIKSNPGPTIWLCSVCLLRITRNHISVQCNSCLNWVHQKRCSGLLHHRLWNSDYIVPCCIQHTPTNFSPTLPPGFVRFMDQNKVAVAAIQETFLSSKSSLNPSNYTLLRKDRTHKKCGGLAFIIHNNIQYRIVNLPAPADNNTIIEQQAIAVSSGTTEITLINVYIPPTSSCPKGYHG